MKRCMGCMKEYEEEYGLCPYCGYMEGDGAASEYHLPPGSTLEGRYLIGRVMGFGGFGITYTGWDQKLSRRVAIKEYLPSQYATRTRDDSTLTIYSGEKEKRFLEGMEKFYGEARRLAKFHGTDGIVQIFDTFQENKTAYIVMEYLEGETLKERLEREGQIPVDETIGLMIPVLESLEIVHKEGILHRDIAPDNIFLCQDGEGNVRAKLLDFGAARFVGGHQSRSLSVLVKEGYSPYEQYRSDGEQGPWTDVYAVAATMYHMITGVRPQNAMERYSRDAVVPIRKLANIEKSTEAAILNAMNITYEYRTNDAGLFLEELRSDQVKRVRDRIIRTDIGRWPRWMKVTASTAAAAVTVLLVLLATGVIHFDILGWGESTVPEGMARVPNLISMTEYEAEKKAGKNELVYQILGKEYSDEIPAGKVLAQTMLGGSIVDAECTIGVIISGGAEKTYVPDVVHFMEDIAAKMIAGANLTYSASQEEGDDAPGSVASQDIAAGTQVDAGSGMKLVISTGRGFDASQETTVPDVTGKKYEDGKAMALESHLYLAKGEIVYDKTIPAGQILGQTPAAGEKTAQGGTIVVKVSSGAAMVHVPDVQYKALGEAQAMLEAAQLAVQTVYEDNNAVQKDHVIRQSVEAGKEVEIGTTVTIYISKGNEKADQTLTTQDAVVTREVQEEADRAAREAEQKANTASKEDATSKADTTANGDAPAKEGTASKEDTASKQEATPQKEDTRVSVPGVTGRPQAEAQATLTSAKFSCTVIEAYSDTVEKGKVISQSVAAGTKMEPGTLVMLTVSKGPELVAVPSVTGKSRAEAESALRAAKLSCSVAEEFNASVADGVVAAQDTAAGSQVRLGSTVQITVSKGPQAPSGWTTDGSFANNPRYRCESKTQYQTRTRTAEEKTAYTSYSWEKSRYEADGWTLYDTKSGWGPWKGWSEWSTAWPGESDSRQVERSTKTERVQTGTQYHYTTYKMPDGRWSWENGSWRGSASYPGYNCDPTAPLEYRMITKGLDGSSHSTYACNYHREHEWMYWYNEWSEPIWETKSTPIYRYQDRDWITTYYYKKTFYGSYGSWSDWQDSPATKNNVTEVNTRTVYSYTEK